MPKGLAPSKVALSLVTLTFTFTFTFIRSVSGKGGPQQSDVVIILSVHVCTSTGMQSSGSEWAGLPTPLLQVQIGSPAEDTAARTVIHPLPPPPSSSRRPVLSICRRLIGVTRSFADHRGMLGAPGPPAPHAAHVPRLGSSRKAKLYQAGGH